MRSRIAVTVLGAAALCFSFQVEAIASPAATPGAATPSNSAVLGLTSATYGPRPDPCPEGAVPVEVGGPPPQELIDRQGEGASLCFGAGRHRLTQPLRPKNRDVLIFSFGAVLDGSRPVTAWEREGDQWVARGQTQSFLFLDYVPCENNEAACEYEDLFRDGRPMERVLRRSDLAPGRFYFDEALQKIYMVDSPEGHHMEATVAATGIDGTEVKDVVVRNATIEKFGLFGVVAGPNWIIENSLIQYCHSHGLRAFNGGAVVGSDISRNGNMGIFAKEGTFRFEANRLSFNNYLNFGMKHIMQEPWHAGATKIWGATSVVRRNWSHDNIGDGWWFDTDNIENVVEENLFERNSRFGLFYEISQSGVIRSNTFRNNPGGGLWINTSNDLDVVDNLFDRNRGYSIGFVAHPRGWSVRGTPYEMARLRVHRNEIRMAEGHVGVPHGLPTAFSAGNRFEANRYFVADTNAKYWLWQNGAHSWAEWQAFGQDAGSSLSPLTDS